nr:ribonuclease H-like domain, reverse transcriptase, RNA-dependent DNA polymerase [Tanacetum cinerariifolium]
MSSLFVDTHNVVDILEKSDAAEGFEQIIDFLSGSYIHYALTVNPHIYISCIKQFWNTASVKRSGDVTRLQALVDKKRLCFLSQWKFLIHTILQSLSAKRTSWNEFSTAMTSAVICLSKGQKFNFSKYIFDSLAQVQVDAAVEENVAENVAYDAIPSPLSHDIPSPSQYPSSPPQQPQSSPQAPPQATPLARKVPVVDYQIVLVDNKLRFKIIKADETHQFYISFT